MTTIMNMLQRVTAPPTMAEIPQTTEVKIPPVVENPSARKKKTEMGLMQILQEKGESLREYISRFNRATLGITNLQMSSVLTALLSRQKNHTFRASLCKKPPESMIELLRRGEQYINQKEVMKATKTNRDICDGELEKDDEKKFWLIGRVIGELRITDTDRWDIADFDVKRVLVDTGSAANVLSWEAFEALKMPIVRLKIINTPLQGFGGGTVIPEEVIDLPVVLAMKFPTSHGIGVKKGDQLISRSCYVDSIQENSSPTVLNIEKGDIQQVHRFELAEEVEKCEVEENNKIIIGRSLSKDERITLLNLIQENMDIFAWDSADLRGIDPSVAEHRLNIKKGIKPVKQKKRQFAPDRQDAIKEELEKLLKAGVIEKSNIRNGYPT
ncbi:RNase H domain-containing protein [Abeliophyllum distichum]|uniref:RNase H domain-containing protein n=1 Tax=Abeliophyllum distichum TaxID=126358 RepID=A0ABD1NRE4_9LAMI